MGRLRIALSDGRGGDTSTGDRHGAGGSFAIIIKAGGNDTAGSFFLSETTIDTGFPRRRFTATCGCVKCFYALDGVLTMGPGDETHRFGRGTFVCLPPGVGMCRWSTRGLRPEINLWFNPRADDKGTLEADHGAHDHY